MIPFETANIQAYRLLLRIEIALRELIRRAYQDEFGARWRRRIPGDLLRKIRESESTDAAKKQFGFRRLGPLYYLTFGELLTLLDQKTCAPILARLGGPSFVSQVANLSGPRNAISHARAVSSAALAAAEALYAQLESAYSPSGLAALLRSPDVGLDPHDIRSRCAAWLRRLHQDVAQLHTPLDPMPDHQIAVNQYWWGNAQFAGFDTNSVDEIAKLVRAYNALPPGIGVAADRRRFVTQNDLQNKLQIAIQLVTMAGDEHANP